MSAIAMPPGPRLAVTIHIDPRAESTRIDATQDGAPIVVLDELFFDDTDLLSGGSEYQSVSAALLLLLHDGSVVDYFTTRYFRCGDECVAVSWDAYALGTGIAREVMTEDGLAIDMPLTRVAE